MSYGIIQLTEVDDNNNATIMAWGVNLKELDYWRQYFSQFAPPDTEGMMEGEDIEKLSEMGNFVIMGPEDGQA